MKASKPAVAPPWRLDRAEKYLRQVVENDAFGNAGHWKVPNCSWLRAPPRVDLFSEQGAVNLDFAFKEPAKVGVRGTVTRGRRPVLKRPAAACAADDAEERIEGAPAHFHEEGAPPGSAAAPVKKRRTSVALPDDADVVLGCTKTLVLTIPALNIIYSCCMPCDESGICP